MGQRALVFPGQGSQFVGMGVELAAASAEARRVFAEVDDALGQPLSKLMGEGPEDALVLTENAQPAIMAVSLAVFRSLTTALGRPPEELFQYYAGHSLGEYSALCASGAIGLADCARLLRLRGQAMQEAVPPGAGAMAAVIGLELETIRALLAAADLAGVCAPANDNAPGQVTISGDQAAVEQASAVLAEAGAKRVLPLAVSAPFHCALMEPAAERMREHLAAAAIGSARVPVVANVTARPVENSGAIRELLVQQITGMVRWRESAVFMAGEGVRRFGECGAGKVLSGLVRRIVPEAQVHGLHKPGELTAFAATLAQDSDQGERA